MVDTFQKFTFTCLKYYGLDPCHYFSAPGLSWDAMLKMTKEELEKISTKLVPNWYQISTKFNEQK